MLYLQQYVSYKGCKLQKWPSRSLKVIGTGATQQATYDFLLFFRCIYVSVWYRFKILSVISI